MSHLVARILLGALLVPMAVVVCVIMHVVLDRYLSWPDDMWTANCAAAALMMIGWCLLWRGFVSWTATRVGLTVVAVIPALVLAVASGHIVEGGFFPLDVFAYVWVTAVSWMFLTSFIWRETSRERIARLAGN